MATLAGLGMTALSSGAQAAQAADTLFVIRRSKNRNTIYFDVRTPAESAADPAQPVNVYWRLFEEDGRTEPLTWAERELAYGYEVVGARARDVFHIRLRACNGRTIQVHLDGTPRALLPIAGKPAVLREIYVATDESALVPKVRHVDLIGLAVGTQLPLRERLHP
jgi:Domain of unknown function (DUF4833)